MRAGNKLKADKKKSKLGISTETPANSIMDLAPLFSLTHIQAAYCLSKCTREEKAALADKMHLLCTLTWREIFNSPRHANGFESLPNTAFNHVPEKFKDEKIIAFRFDGKKPMVGFRKREVFYILWLDRDFTLYRHS